MKKIKLLVSDFDGVVISLKDIHYQTLNKALAEIDPKFVISEQLHISTLDGKTSKNKLKYLVETQNFPLDKVQYVLDLKQKYTLEALENFNDFNLNIKPAIEKLKSEGYLFYIASNATLETIRIGCEKLDILHLVDRIYSNTNAKNAKPHSEIYLRCMVDAGVHPSETLILEDSKNGRAAASNSGAFVCDMDSPDDFSYELIKNSIAEAEKAFKPKPYPCKNKLQVVIPASGGGRRFADAGFLLPKPLIDVAGKCMIQRVVENLNIDAHYIFIVQKEHCEKYNLKTVLNLIAPGCDIVETDGLTEGAACSVLLAKDLINNDKQLLIANSDQIIEDFDAGDFLYSMVSKNADGGILTFEANESKWSYAKVDDEGNVVEVAEKIVISDKATVGIYFFKSGKEFVKYAEQMIAKNIRTNGEFYLCPVYNEFILDGKKINIFDVNDVFGTGTPEDLNKYLKKL